MSQAPALFKLCVQAIVEGELIQREGRSDKEFHFQNWFSRRLTTLGVHFDQPGRNTYPDFRLVEHVEGYEVKGLAYPGREADYELQTQRIPNPGAGNVHVFAAYRVPGDPAEVVTMRDPRRVMAELQAAGADDDVD